MCSKRWLSSISYLALLMLVCPFLMTWQAGQAYADSPTLDLQLEAPDVTRWNIGNIKPGDSAIKPINLHNNGNTNGYLLIWIADLVDDEGANPESETGNTADPGELSSYIYLDIINDGMTFYRLSGGVADLPISLKSFPDGVDRALYIASTPIGAGQTLELRWQWTLSPDAGNDVQGDTVSFSIYYSLVGSVPYGYIYLPGGEEPYPSESTTPEVIDNYPPESTPELEPPAPTPIITPIGARSYTSADNRCVINIPEGVRIMTGSGKELLDVIIDTPDSYPVAPEPFIFAGPVYRIQCITPDGEIQGTALNQDVQLTMYFDPAAVPENTEIAIFSYHPGSGWVKLDCVVGPSGDCLTAWVDYLDLVALLILSKDNGATHLLPTTPASHVTPYKGNVSGVRQVFTQVSLGVAILGTVAMMVLAYIQRRRRNRQAEQTA